MQERLFEFRADDKTLDINSQLLGVIEPGVYRGFDADLTPSGLTLHLVHTLSGASYSNGTPEVVTNVGVLRTKQGTVIRETEEVTLVIGTNAVGAGHPSTRNRIDLIVCEHWHQDVNAGVTAIYYAIPGVQASSPVAPDLTLPEKQLIIGQLYLPGGCDDLSADGVIWTKATLPLNPSLPDTAFPAFYDSVNRIIDSFYKDRAYYYIAESGIAADYPEVDRFDMLTIPNMVATIISNQKYKFVGNNGIVLKSDSNWIISEAFEEIQIYRSGDQYGNSAGDCVLVTTGRLYKNQVNKLYRALIGNVGTAGTLAAGLLTCDPDGNVQKVAVTTNSDFKGIVSFAQPNTLPGYNSGMQLIVQIDTTYRITVKHLASGLSAPYKPIYVYGKKDVMLSGNMTLYLYEDAAQFVLMHWNADTVLGATAGQFSNRNGVFCGNGSTELAEAFKSMAISELSPGDLLFVDELVVGVPESGNFRYTAKIKNAPTVGSLSVDSAPWLTWTALVAAKKSGWERIVLTEDDGSGVNAVVVIDWTKLTLTSYQPGGYIAGALFGVSLLTSWYGGALPDNPGELPLVTITESIPSLDGSCDLYIVEATADVTLTLKPIVQVKKRKFSIKNQTEYVCKVQGGDSEMIGYAMYIHVPAGKTATLYKNKDKYEVTGDYEEFFP